MLCKISNKLDSVHVLCCVSLLHLRVFKISGKYLYLQVLVN